MGEPLAFKSAGRASRAMVVENNYSLGMMYTDNALEENYIKFLLNYNYKDDGNVLVPRGGLQPIPGQDKIDLNSLLTVRESSQRFPYMSFMGNVDVRDPNAQVTDYRTRCFIVVADCGANVNSGTKLNQRTYGMEVVDLFVQNPQTGKFVRAALSDKVDYSDVDAANPGATTAQEQLSYYLKGEVFEDARTLHGMRYSNYLHHRPLFTTFDNTPYVFFTAGMSSTIGVGQRLGRIKISSYKDTYRFAIEPVQPTTLSVKEVLSSGYNMLLKEPYAFKNTAATGYAIDGILPYNKAPGGAGRELLLSARPGQSVNFEAYYQYKDEVDFSFTARWEMYDPNSSDVNWTVLQSQKANDDTANGAPASPAYSKGASCNITFQPTVNQFQLRVSFYRRTNASGAIEEKPMKMMIMPIYKLTADQTSNTQNLRPVKYDLTTATGMLTWKQRVVLWGVRGVENMLFTSEVNNPAYFPYPNNIDLFDENVIHVIQYLDGLLAFTATQCYMVQLVEGGGFTSTVVQNRLNLSFSDKDSIQVIKNMVYFRSDNYYYMIVPKANSFKGELLIAPVSKPITNMLDRFETTLNEVLKTVYYKEFDNPADPCDTYLYGYYNYVDGTTVRNVYIFQTSFPNRGEMGGPPKNRNFSFVLNYDTNIRTWSAHCYECCSALIPFQEVATDGATLLHIGYLYESYGGAPPREFTWSCIELVKQNTQDAKDTFECYVTPAVRNYQYLDTGYRKIGDQHKKRFREIQMKLNNTSKKALQFYTDFILDDAPRQTYYTYEVRHVTDPYDTNFGLVYVERAISPTLTLAGTTVLADENTPDQNMWTLDSSKLPPLSVIKVRFAVSGKGYAPRLKIMSLNERTYELLNINWVFRTLYAR